jgi:urease alpha subunit
MGARIRAFDWSSTPLGPIGAWPLSLRGVLSVIFRNITARKRSEEAIRKAHAELEQRVRDRTIGKKHTKRNEATPKTKVDADTYQVWVDGKKVGSEPLKELPMALRYFLF